LDLLETLLEEVVEDAQRRCGTYPDSERVMDAASRLFDELRQLIREREKV
jgi:hypothetical protein